MTKFGLVERQSDLPERSGRGASRQFGGTRIFAATERDLAREVDCVSKAIVDTCAATPALTPSMLRYLVEQDLTAKLPKRVFGALLGSQLRTGGLDAVVCEGVQRTPYRVILHSDRVSEFSGRVREIARHLVQGRMMRISDVRDKYFPQKPKGSWTHAMYLAARLVRLGFAEYPDQYCIKMPDSVANAILHTDDAFHSTDG